MMPGRRHRRRRLRHGFTLVEAIAGIVIVTILGTIASTLMAAGMSAYTGAAVRARLQQNGSTGLEFISALLREIPADPDSSELAPDITSVSATSITWSTSSLSLSGTTVHYVQEGGPPLVLLTGIASINFACFDESNTPLPAALSGHVTQAIQRIEVTLTLQDRGATEVVRTRVFVRSLMTGADS